ASAKLRTGPCRITRWDRPTASAASSAGVDTVQYPAPADTPAWHSLPMLRAERDLARAPLTTTRPRPDPRAGFTAAIAGLRQHSTPCHLAHGLLDHAQHLATSARCLASGA